MKPTIEKTAFDAWATTKLVEYVSCNVPYRKGMTQRLVFGAFVGGGYKVTCGYETLYEGASFSEAQKAFEGAIGEAIPQVPAEGSAVECSICYGSGKVSDGYEDFRCWACGGEESNHENT